MAKMWDIRRREMHIQLWKRKKKKDWKQDFSTPLAGHQVVGCALWILSTSALAEDGGLISGQAWSDSTATNQMVGVAGLIANIASVFWD
jgi:hypothetical protein